MKKRNFMIIIASTVLFVITLIIFNSRLLKVHYYVFKNDHFEKNDKVYLSEKIYSRQDTGIVIPLFGKLKPMNNNLREDIAIMPFGVSIDSLRKYKTRFIGIYAQSAVLYGKTNNGFIPGPFCAFKPEKRFIKIDSLFASKIPAGYKIDVEYYYLPYSLVAKK